MALEVPVWTIEELAILISKRISADFDANILVSGNTGLGKSTLILEILNCFNKKVIREKSWNRLGKFKIEKHLTFSRTEMIDLIKNQKYSFCWQDEMITSGFKRRWFEKEQIQLIEVLTKYRNHFNVLFSAIPVMSTLDKEMLKLFSMHINIVKRGIGIIHFQRPGRQYSDDPWDTKQNAHQEEEWSKKTIKNPKFKIPYGKYSTFVGLIFFGKLSEKQEKKYEKLKGDKRKKGEEIQENGNDKLQENFYDKVLKLLKEGKLDEQGLFQLCQFEGKKLSSVKVRLNQILKDEGKDKTLKNLLKKSKADSKQVGENGFKSLESLEPPTTRLEGS